MKATSSAAWRGHEGRPFGHGRNPCRRVHAWKDVALALTCFAITATQSPCCVRHGARMQDEMAGGLRGHDFGRAIRALEMVDESDGLAGLHLRAEIERDFKNARLRREQVVFAPQRLGENRSAAARGSRASARGPSARRRG